MTVYEKLTGENCKRAAEIYNYYVTNSAATYATEEISDEEFAAYYQLGNELTMAYNIVIDGAMAGFCLLRPWNAHKKAYSRTYEATMYLDKACCSKGIGREAMIYLEKQAEERGILVIMCGIDSENTASCRLCESLGYEKCAHLKKVGFKFGKFMDIVYYQKIYE